MAERGTIQRSHGNDGSPCTTRKANLDRGKNSETPLTPRGRDTTSGRSVGRWAGLLTIGAGLAGAAYATKRLVEHRRSSENDDTALMNGSRSYRTAQLAGMGARTGVNLATMKAKSVFASEERKQELREEFELQSAEQVAEALGNMRGAIMKLGQMASYLDQGLPEPVRNALSQLQSDAPPMSFDLARGVIEAELGAPVSELFASIDEEPLAAASIGQVHRAVLHDGREVAVKVQYPGVGEAVQADLDNSDLLFQIIGMLFPGLDPKPLVNELRERVAEELDYTLEAANQQEFADAYRGHPFIHVPDVVPERSARRVLTTELAEGAKWSELLEWSQEEKNLAAETLYRFAFGGIYQLHMFNGDPHPGNYLFRPGGRVTFLDFGLCKRFTEEEIEVFEEMIIAMVRDGDLPRYIQLVKDAGILPADLEVDENEAKEYFGHFYEFVFTDEEMEMTPEYAAESIRRFFDLTSPHAQLMKSANLPAFMVIVQRINLGLFALFGELHARGNWRRIAEELWPFADGEPSTPMGEEIARWEASRAAGKVSGSAG